MAARAGSGLRNQRMHRREGAQLHPATVLSNRYNFSMAFDPGFKATLMFGGFSTAAARGGTWLLGLAQ
jgi:hypothetical protein